MPKKLSTLTKILYGTGDLGYSMTNSIIATIFPLFMMDVVGISPGLAAIALFIGRSWDYINDPIIGYLSDRTRSRFGRRRPWLLFGALPFGLAFLLLWIKPDIANTTALVLFYAFLYLLYEFTATAVYMPYFALTPELSEDYDERTQVTSFRMLFNIIGGLIAYTLPMMLIGSVSPANADRLILMGAVFGAVAAIPYLVVFFSTKERKDFVPEQPPKLIPSLKSALKNKPFIFAAGIYLVTWLTIIILETNLLIYIKYGVLRESQSSIIMAVMFITAIIALPFWTWISKKGNKRKAYMIGVAFWAVVMCALVLVRPETPFWVLLVMCFLVGIGLSAAQVLPWAIIPDAIEWDEYQTGERHEGVFYSLITLLGKIANSIAVPVSLMVLELTGYVANAAQQPKSTLTGLKIMIGPIPALLLITGILFAYFYPLSREKYTHIVSELQQRRKDRKHQQPGHLPG